MPIAGAAPRVYNSIVCITDAPGTLSDWPREQKETNVNEFRPGQPWLDNNGVAINAHGGGILYHDQVYCWYGQRMTEGEARCSPLAGVLRAVFSAK